MMMYFDRRPDLQLEGIPNPEILFLTVKVEREVQRERNAMCSCLWGMFWKAI